MLKQNKKLAKRVWKNYSKYRRMLAANPQGYVRCITCNTIKSWKETQLGHYYHRGRGAWTNIDFDDINTQIQCVSCNYYKSGNLNKFAEYLVDKYGKNIIDIMAAKNKMKKIVSNEELEGINEYCLQEIKLMREDNFF